MDPMVDILVPDRPRLALPLMRTIQITTNALWHMLASIPLTAKGVECKYFVPSKGYKHLFTHPQPGTLVIEVVNHKERQGQPGPTPKSKDAKKLDFFGRKVYSTGGAPASHNESTSRPQTTMLLIPGVLWPNSRNCSDSHSEFGMVLEEGKVVARTSLQAALDSADSAMRTMGMAITEMQLLATGLRASA